MKRPIDLIIEFINEYYIEPIIYDTGYNPINTISWGIILVICLFAILKLLDVLKIEIDQKFIASLVPFVVSGALLRVVEDAGIVDAPLSYLLITPLIFFLVTGITLLCILLGKVIQKYSNINLLKQDKTVLVMGSIFAIIILYQLLQHTTNKVNIWVPLQILTLTLIIAVIIGIFIKKGYLEILSKKINFSIMIAHIFDASSTYVGINMGAREKHVIPALFIDITGTPAVMFVLKFLVIIVALLIVRLYIKDEREFELKNLILFTLLVLGLAPGIRNTIRLTIGV